jgi:hypothetical protein
MAPWKTHFDIGTRVSGQSRNRSRSRPQRDHPTTLHALGDESSPGLAPAAPARADHASGEHRCCDKKLPIPKSSDIEVFHHFEPTRVPPGLNTRGVWDSTQRCDHVGPAGPCGPGRPSIPGAPGAPGSPLGPADAGATWRCKVATRHARTWNLSAAQPAGPMRSQSRNNSMLLYPSYCTTCFSTADTLPVVLAFPG